MERIDIPKPVKGKDYIQRLAVQQNGLAIQYIPCPSKELCLMACDQNGLAIQYIDSPTDEMWEAAVNQNGMAIQFMNFVSDLEEVGSESETEETTPIFTDEQELEYPNLSDMSEVVNYLAKGGQLVDHLGNPIERGTISEMIEKANEHLWKFPENGPQVENVIDGETNFAYSDGSVDPKFYTPLPKYIPNCLLRGPISYRGEEEPLIQDREQLNTVELGESIFPNNIKKPFTTSIHTGNCMGGCFNQDSDVYKFPTFDPTFNFSGYGPLAGNSVIDGEPQFAYNPELPPVNYESPFGTKDDLEELKKELESENIDLIRTGDTCADWMDTKAKYPAVAGNCEKCNDHVIPNPCLSCDNDCNTVKCVCGDEYHRTPGTRKGSFLVKGHNPNCGCDSDDSDIPELEFDSVSNSSSFTCI